MRDDHYKNFLICYEEELEHFSKGIRQELVRKLEAEIRPLLEKDRLHEGGYDCCGCSTYADILNHAIRIVRGDG